MEMSRRFTGDALGPAAYGRISRGIEMGQRSSRGYFLGVGGNATSHSPGLQVEITA
jgi:hypothetical protein